MQQKLLKNHNFQNYPTVSNTGFTFSLQILNRNIPSRNWAIPIQPDLIPLNVQCSNLNPQA